MNETTSNPSQPILTIIPNNGWFFQWVYVPHSLWGGYWTLVAIRYL